MLISIDILRKSAGPEQPARSGRCQDRAAEELIDPE
jgi:hypothetical protein